MCKELRDIDEFVGIFQRLYCILLDAGTIRTYGKTTLI